MNLTALIQLAAKYAPVVIGIIQREGPAIEALIADLHALNAGQAPTAVIPQSLTSTQFPPA